MSRITTVRRSFLINLLVLVSAALLLQACGSDKKAPPPPAAPSSYQMGGALQGIALNLNLTATTVPILAGSTTATSGTSNSTDGTGATALFNSPQGITTDGTYLYVADTTNHTIRRTVIATGATTTLAGLAGTFGTSNSTDGTGATARFNLPQGITTDGTYIYVADTNNFGVSAIRRTVIATGATTALVVGTAEYTAPQGITTDGHGLLISDGGTHVLRVIR